MRTMPEHSAFQPNPLMYHSKISTVTRTRLPHHFFRSAFFIGTVTRWKYSICAGCASNTIWGWPTFLFLGGRAVASNSNFMTSPQTETYARGWPSHNSCTLDIPFWENTVSRSSFVFSLSSIYSPILEGEIRGSFRRVCPLSPTPFLIGLPNATCSSWPGLFWVSFARLKQFMSFKFVCLYAMLMGFPIWPALQTIRIFWRIFWLIIIARTYRTMITVKVVPMMYHDFNTSMNNFIFKVSSSISLQNHPLQGNQWGVGCAHPHGQ